MKAVLRPTLWALAFAALPAAPLAAQMPMLLGSWNTGLLAGVSVPTGSTADAFNTGWTGAAWLSYSPIGGKLAVRAQVQYQHFEQAEATTTDNVDITGGSVELVALLPSVYLRPYLLGGVGPYHTSGGDTDFGWHGGAGFLFSVLGRRLLFEARYLSIGSGGGAFKTVPITLGIVF